MPPRRLSSRKAWQLYSIALLLPLVLFQLKTSFLISDDDVNHYSSSNHAAVPPQQQQQREETTIQNEFNYTLFWQHAKKAALTSLQAEQQQQQRRPACPKVYVYNMSHLNDAYDSSRKPSGFGMPVLLEQKSNNGILQGHLYKTNQYAFPSILLERLQASNECYTTNPKEADLWYVPLLPAPKDMSMWKTSCSHLTGETVRNALPHLDRNNACRHFFAIGKSHTDLGDACKGWFSNPISALKEFARLAYSNYSFVVDKKSGAHAYDEKDTTQATVPNLYSVPYPSSLHFLQHNHTLSEFLYTNKKKILMSFMGKDSHGDVAVRKRITKQCRQYPKHCSNLKWKGTPDFITRKMRATFCLEPPGDTPGRKSLSDSITFGCIPVLFSELTDNVAPWHWLQWKDRARILVPRDEFVSGRIDLKTLLTSIPTELLELMQTTLKTKSRQFQYSLDDDQEDGIRIILDNLHREAMKKEFQGLCGY